MRGLLLTIVLAVSAGGAAPGPMTQVGWGELAPAFSASENPFYWLSADEARLVGILVDIDAARKAGDALPDKMIEGEAIALAALESVGVDGAAKVEAVTAFGSRLEDSRTSLNDALLGEVIEIPGYALPLEFDGVRVTEFLLVPWAGACIHTPPPPSNQIIHVRSPDGFEMRGLFDPVVVSGELRSSDTNMDVDLSDGIAEFPVGYQMVSDAIRLYR